MDVSGAFALLSSVKEEAEAELIKVRTRIGGLYLSAQSLIDSMCVHCYMQRHTIAILVLYAPLLYLLLTLVTESMPDHLPSIWEVRQAGDSDYR